MVFHHLAFFACFSLLANIFNKCIAHVIYMIEHEGGRIISITSLAGFDDGPVLSLGLWHPANIGNESDQVMLRAIA